MSTPLCTVLIAFDEPGQTRFETLRSLGESMGFQTMRVAQYYSSGMILEEIVRSIRDAHLIIADLTDGNPNVCYELGIAHALGKRVFLVSEDPKANAINFGESRVCGYAEMERLTAEFRSLVSTPGILSPIDFFSGGLAVAGQSLTLKRAGAFALDVLFASALAMALLIPIAWLFAGSATVYLENATVSLVFLYFLLSSILLGTSPAQRLLGLKVTRLNRSEPSLGQRCLRPIAAILTVLSLGTGFLWAARSPRHQAVHDIISRTLVLRRSTLESIPQKEPAAAALA